MSKKQPKDVAVLTGYDENGTVVYQQSLALAEYWDGEHVWDSSEGVRKLRLAKIIGVLYESDGTVFQQFETAFSPTTGKYLGSKGRHGDGEEAVDGIYKTHDPPMQRTGRGTV